MKSSLLTPARVSRMVTHWLNTPVNGYDGSGYGNDLKSILQTPLAAGLASDQVAKMRADLPLLSSLPTGTINIYLTKEQPDKVFLTVQVGMLNFSFGQ